MHRFLQCSMFLIHRKWSWSSTNLRCVWHRLEFPGNCACNHFLFFTSLLCRLLGIYTNLLCRCHSHGIYFLSFHYSTYSGGTHMRRGYLSMHQADICQMISLVYVFTTLRIPAMHEAQKWPLFYVLLHISANASLFKNPRQTFFDRGSIDVESVLPF